MGEKFAEQGSGQRSPLSSDSLLSQSPPGTLDRVGTSARDDRAMSALRAPSCGRAVVPLCCCAVVFRIFLGLCFGLRAFERRTSVARLGRRALSPLSHPILWIIRLGLTRPTRI